MFLYYWTFGIAEIICFSSFALTSSLQFALSHIPLVYMFPFVNSLSASPGSFFFFFNRHEHYRTRLTRITWIVGANMLEWTCIGLSKLVLPGCHNQIPQTESLKQHKLTSYSSGGGKFKIQVLDDVIPSDGSLGLEMTTFSVYPHMVKRVSKLFGTSYKETYHINPRFILVTSFNLFHFLTSENNLWVRASTHEFWGHEVYQIFSA